MKPTWKRLFGVGAVLIVVLGVAACASTSQPFEYHDDREEKAGPGLFSGEAGGFVITGDAEGKTKDAESEPTVKP